MLHWLARLLTRNVLRQERNNVVVLETWTNVPMGCCDCGLIHRYDFFLDRAGRLCVRARRDFLLTDAIRQSRVFTHTGVGSAAAAPHPTQVIPAFVREERRRVQRFRTRMEQDVTNGSGTR